MTSDMAMAPDQAEYTLPVSEYTFAFDLETTGTSAQNDTPCQMCLVSENAAGYRRILLNTLVRPAKLIDPGAMEVHGITNEMAATGPDYAMMAWTAHLLCREMRPGYLVGFNSISFDEPMINNCLGTKVFSGPVHIDVLNVAYRYFPTMASHKLGQLYEVFMGHPLTGAHDASVDVFGTLDLLTAMRAEIGMTMAQLAVEMAEPRPYSVVPIGKHKGKKPQDVPVGWAKWMSQNANDMRPDLKRTVEFILAGCKDLP